MENIKRNFLGSLPIHGDPHNQRENDSVGLLEQRMQCKLVPAGNGSD